MFQRSFHAMGSEISLWLPEPFAAAGPRVLLAVQGRFSLLEARFSRFLPASELSALNRHNTRAPWPVSSELFALLERCGRHVQHSDGWFHPGLESSLCAWGYAHTFDLGATPLEATPPVPGDWKEVQLDATRQSLVKPPSMKLDFGGFLKGLTVDLCRPLLPEQALLDAGGDLYAKGLDENQEPWKIELAHPFEPENALCEVEVSNRAVATSSRLRRRWQHGHHLLDPFTLAPSRSPIVQVSVLAPDTETADVAAKSLLLMGPTAARSWLQRYPKLEAVLVYEDGSSELLP